MICITYSPLCHENYLEIQENKKERKKEMRAIVKQSSFIEFRVPDVELKPFQYRGQH